MPEQIGFRRNMGLFMAVMIGIGATMGPGIFALPGELAHMIGPLGVLVYLAMGFLTLEDDGRNVIAALQARQLKLEKVIAIVQNHEYT